MSVAIKSNNIFLNIGLSSFLAYVLPAFAECPVRKDGDECEKGIRRSSRMPKILPACTKRFSEGRLGEQVSEGGYASAGFAEAVKMLRAEARGASLYQKPIPLKVPLPFLRRQGI
jgi:hypothetical protein